MQYKLITGKSLNNDKTITDTVLNNRGILDTKEYINLKDDVFHSYALFGEVINTAVDLLLEHIDKRSPIQIIVDPDTDGFSSASLLFMYIRDTLGYTNIMYCLHEKKAHGISEDIRINPSTKLLLVPDGGTNDIEASQRLSSQGIDVVILDHHLAEQDNVYATIVNNQTSSYPNKQLCGAGVVYKFLQALDDRTWNTDSDNYLDVIAIAHVGDIMDLREHETRRLVTKGLQQIEHPLIKAFLNKRAYDVSNTDSPTAMDIAFYIVPLINATIRCGTMNEKDLLFRAFIKDYEEFDYKPRRKHKDDPEPDVIKEDIYTRVARLCSNAKGRQDKIKTKAVQTIVEMQGSKNKDNIIFFANTTDIVEPEFSGLIASEIAKKYNRPCLALRKISDSEIYKGSARNVNDGLFENLKTELSNSNLFKSTAGHQGAFGLEIKRANIPLAINYFNQMHPNFDFKPIHKVDFVRNGLNYAFFKELESLRWLYSSFVEEHKIAIEELEINVADIEVFGKDNKIHWKVNIDDIEYIQFNRPVDDEMVTLDVLDFDIVIINAVGTTRMNRYGNKIIPQFIISEYEIVEKTMIK